MKHKISAFLVALVASAHFVVLGTALPGCGAAGAAAIQTIATVFNSVAMGLQLIEQIRGWLELVKPALDPGKALRLTQALDASEALLLQARELGLQGKQMADEANELKQKGMGFLQTAWNLMKELGFVRSGKLVEGPGRAEGMEMRVHLPPEITP